MYENYYDFEVNNDVWTGIVQCGPASGCSNISRDNLLSAPWNSPIFLNYFCKHINGNNNTLPFGYCSGTYSSSPSMNMCNDGDKISMYIMSSTPTNTSSWETVATKTITVTGGTCPPTVTCLPNGARFPVPWFTPAHVSSGWLPPSRLNHDAIDIVGAVDRTSGVLNPREPLYAPAAGEVIYNSDPGWAYGLQIVLKHPNPNYSSANTTVPSHFYSLFAHNEEAIIIVGQQVTAGQLLGFTDNTGLSSGSHIHMEITIGTLNDNFDTYYAGGRARPHANRRNPLTFDWGNPQ